MKLLLLLVALGADPHELARKLDRLYRSDSSHARVTMHVTTPEWERELSLEMWSRGMDQTLIRIRSPEKEAGTATLRRQSQMWNFLPRIRRTILVPPSLMMGSWMGSDFTNDDLVRETSWDKDYDLSLAPSSPAGQTCLLAIPRSGAAVTWSKVVSCFDAAGEVPLSQDFYDEKGRLARRLTFSDVRTIDGRKVPMHLTLVPQLESGHRTDLVYQELDLATAVPERMFSVSELERTH